ncbi:MAG: sortase domain-containing protein [Acidimicrobiales bacterium]
MRSGTRAGNSRSGNALSLITLATVVVVSACAVGALSYSLWWQHRQSSAGASLVSKIRSAESSLNSSTNMSCGSTTTGSGSLPGILKIPTLQVTAPVEAGLSDATLAVAVGHASSTPLPGPGATSALSAHDVGYFSHLNSLAIGDSIYYLARCASYHYIVVSKTVTTAGSAIATPVSGALVLSTCWPLNALFWTKQRYVVIAAYASSSARLPTSSNLDPHGPHFIVPAPASLKARGITLSSYSQVMGTLSLVAGTPYAWAVSPAPLAATGVAESEWIGLHRAAKAQDKRWWSALAPNTPLPRSLPPRSGALEISASAPWGAAGPITLRAWDENLVIQIVISHGVAVVSTVHPTAKGT